MTNLSSREIWAVVHSEHHALINDLAALEAAKWGTTSLCVGWDVHDVLAHLIDSAKTTRLGFLRRMVAAGFDFDRDNTAGITREKSAIPEDTLSVFRAVCDHTATPPAPPATRLVEAFVHIVRESRPTIVEK